MRWQILANWKVVIARNPYHGNNGSAQAVSGDRFREVDPFLGFGVVRTEDQHGKVKHEKASRAKGETHDSTGAKGRVETGCPSTLLGRNGGTSVTKDGHFHAQVSASL